MAKRLCRPGRWLAFAALLGLAGGAAHAGQAEEKVRQQQREIEQLRAENKALQTLLRQREQQILDIGRKLDEARREQAAASAERDVARKRMELLLERVRELEKATARAAAGKASGGPNPPPGQVKGVVEKVNADPKGGPLVQISIGSDAGLAVGHTLEVYRLKPQPTYLGMIRIVNVEARQAVGRLVPRQAGGRPADVRPGDHVASRVEP